MALPPCEAVWEPGEWADLIAGRLGPWAFGLEEERVVALCHTSVACPSAAEAGVWTHPDHRGQGWAPMVTSAWAKEAGATFENLFYSTDFANLASQAVARKLGLEGIGALWQLKACPA